jgi:uncharacterized DUF497 family protein
MRPTVLSAKNMEFRQPILKLCLTRHSPFSDLAHLRHEERFIAIGKTRVVRSILLVFTRRKRNREMFFGRLAPVHSAD